MASYSDRPSSLSSFTPYVQQLPVEAMVKVGTTLQGRYDQGVQRIQSQIDRVAGLSIMRDVDKQYLKSKMSQLGGNLRAVSMGDFSNYQLVTSVGGMVNQVGRDKKIQNAVYSTANDQKQQSVIESARAKGEMAPENEWEYQKKREKYMSSPTPGDLFTDQYTPYTDVNKKILAIAKEIGVEERTIQEIFQTKADGSWDLDADGKPKINYVMAEKHLKGKDPAKILSAFQLALTPADYNQLAITGRYTKSGISSEGLKKEIMTNYSSDLSSIDNKIQEIGIKLIDEKSKNKQDPSVITSLEKQKELLSNAKIKLISSRDEDVKQVDVDPDAVRASLYTNRYLTGMARDLSALTEETTYKVNPHFTVMMDLNKFKFDQEQFRVKNAQWEYQQRQEDIKNASDASMKALELWYKYGWSADGNPPPGIGAGGVRGTKQALEIEGMEAAIANAPQEEYNGMLSELNKINYGLAFKYNKSLMPSWTDNQVHDAMRRNAEKEGVSLEDYSSKFASKQIDKWKRDPKGIPDEMRGLISDQYILTKQLVIKKGDIEKANKLAEQRVREKGLTFPTQEEIDRNVKGTYITIGGRTISLSKSDVVDFAQVHPEASDAFAAYTGSDEVDRNRQTSEQRIIAKFGLALFLEMEKAIFNYDRGSLLDKANFYFPGNIRSNNEEIKNAGKYLSSTNYKALMKERANVYVESGFVSQGLSHPLVRGDEKEDDFKEK